MKKFLLSFLFLVVGIAYADNTITSKEYVDGQVATLQTQISAKNTNTVVMNTGTAGEIGEKAIYDTTAAYGAQSDALVTAGAFNSAMQNALESEFVCVEWQGSVHDNAHCLLYEVRGAVQTQTLPSGYTQLEYLESTGTQYIDTGVSGLNTGDWEIYVKWVATNTTQQTYACLIGAYSSESQNAYRIIAYGTSGTRYHVYGNSKASWGTPTDSNLATYTAHTGKIRNGGVIIDNIMYDTSQKTGNTIGTTDSIGLFNTRLIATIYNAGFFQGRIYESYALKDNVYMYNIIPARRDSDGELGMYDTVSNTFFTNAGTGEFVAGPVVSSNLYLPSGN